LPGGVDGVVPRSLTKGGVRAGDHDRIREL
jgi:hypothetical protein